MFCLHVYLCAVYVPGAQESQKMVSDPWYWSYYGWQWATVSVLKTKLQSSAREMVVLAPEAPNISLYGPLTMCQAPGKALPNFLLMVPLLGDTIFWWRNWGKGTR